MIDILAYLHVYPWISMVIICSYPLASFDIRLIYPFASFRIRLQFFIRDLLACLLKPLPVRSVSNRVFT